MATFLIPIEKLGIEVEIDEADYPAISLAYKDWYGWKQLTNDAAAPFKQVDIDASLEVYDKCEQAIYNRLARMREGQPPKIGGGRVGKGIMTVMVDLAEDQAKKEFKASGRKLDPKALRKEAKAKVKKFPDVYRRMADLKLEYDAMVASQLEAATQAAVDEAAAALEKPAQLEYKPAAE